jgi:hypothetical protein
MKIGWIGKLSYEYFGRNYKGIPLDMIVKKRRGKQSDWINGDWPPVKVFIFTKEEEGAG